MEFTEHVKRALRVAQLDAAAIDAVSRDERAFLAGLAVVALGGVGYAIGSLMVPVGLLVAPLVAVVSVTVAAVIVHLLAVLAFRGRGEFLRFFRTFSHAHITYWITAVPLLGPPVLWLAWLWTMVIAVVAVERVYGLDRTRAAVCVGILAAAGIAVAVVFGSVAYLAAFLLSARSP